MALPIISKARSWVQNHLKQAPMDYSQYVDDKGQVRIAVVDDTLAAILADLNRIKLALGLQRFDIGSDGQRLYEGLKSLKLDHSSDSNAMRYDSPAFDTLCNDLSRVSRHDFEALKEFWGLEMTPEHVAKMLQYKVSKSRVSTVVRVLPPVVFAALENLRAVSASPRRSIRTSL